MKKVLVTGGTGFIGSALVKALVSTGVEVRSFDNDSRGNARRLAGVDVEQIRGDICDLDAVRSATRGVDCVYHLAYVNGTETFYSEPYRVLDVAVQGMLNVIDACRLHGVRQFVLASSSEVYQTPSRVPTDEQAPLVVPDPFNPRYSYGGGKIVSELMAIHSRIFERVLIFRPHNVYGPDMGREHVIPQLAMRVKRLCAEGIGPVSLPIQGTGRETRAFVYIDDLISGVMLMVERGATGIYHIGTSDEITIADLAIEIARRFGRECTVVPGEAPMGATPRRCPDIRKLAALGFAPKVLLREGLSRTVLWYMGDST